MYRNERDIQPSKNQLENVERSSLSVRPIRFEWWLDG